MMATSERSEEIKMIIVRKRQFGIKRKSFNPSTIKFFTILLCHRCEQWTGRTWSFTILHATMFISSNTHNFLEQESFIYYSCSCWFSYILFQTIVNYE